MKHNKTGRNDPCPCGSGHKYKRCCLNAPRPDQRATNPLNPLSDEGVEMIFKELFLLLKDMFDSLPSELHANDPRVGAIGLSMRIYRQLCTFHHLKTGTPIPFQHGSGVNWDFASMMVIVRSILESYYLLYFIYVDAENPDDRQFRYDAWRLDTSLKREKVYPDAVLQSLLSKTETQEEAEHTVKTLEQDRKNAETLRRMMEENPHYQKVMQSGDPQTQKDYKHMIQHGLLGGWNRIQKKIPQFEHINLYDFFSQFVHSNFLHCIQHFEALSAKDQLELCALSKSVSLMILSRLCMDYPSVFPETKKAHERHPVAAQYAEAILITGAKPIQG